MKLLDKKYLTGPRAKAKAKEKAKEKRIIFFG